jgi:hypothetical protein
MKSHLSNLAGADATRLEAASSDKSGQPLFLVVIRLLFAICRDLLQLALRFHYAGETACLVSTRFEETSRMICRQKVARLLLLSLAHTVTIAMS